MIAIPFIYFLILYIWVVRRRTAFSIISMMVLMYVVTSLFAIIIDYFDLYNSSSCIKTEIHIFPTILYCFLLTLVMYPFYLVNDANVTAMETLPRPYFIDLLIHFYFVLFLLTIFLIPGDIARNWTYAQLNPELKGEIWDGEYKVFSFSGPFLTIAHLCMTFSSASLFLIPIFFYNISFRNKSNFFYLENICGSMTILLFSLLTQDRSRFIYWLMFFILNYNFFHKFFNENQKKKFSKYILFLFSLFLIYVVVMNFIRFGDSSHYDNPALNLISYAGQSFNNFCYFFENLDLPSRQWDHPFPFISSIFDPEARGTREWAFYILDNTGINILVFSTFLGQIASYIGFGYMILWCFGISFLSACVMKVSSVYTLFDLMKLVILAVIPYLGLFVYFFGGWKVELLAALFLIFSYKACSEKNDEVL